MDDLMAVIREATLIFPRRWCWGMYCRITRSHHFKEDVLQIWFDYGLFLNFGKPEETEQQYLQERFNIQLPAKRKLPVQWIDRNDQTQFL